MRKMRPPFPTRSWTNTTGPADSAKIASAQMSIIGRANGNASTHSVISIARLAIRYLGSKGETLGRLMITQSIGLLSQHGVVSARLSCSHIQMRLRLHFVDSLLDQAFKCERVIGQGCC